MRKLNMKHWVHTSEDGRGPRDVYLNGKLIKHAVRADERAGKVFVLDYPIKLDKHRKRCIGRTLRGEVSVVLKA